MGSVFQVPGPDKLMAEHLIEGSDVVTIWLTDILNAVIDLELGPDSLKQGVVVPVYKGSGNLCHPGSDWQVFVEW